MDSVVPDRVLGVVLLIAGIFILDHGLFLRGVLAQQIPVESPSKESSTEPSTSRSDLDAHALAFFETRIRPVLVQHCYECHSTETEINGGLALDSRDGWMKGGDTGPAIVPGKPAEGSVLRAITYGDPRLKMPPDGKLPKEIVEDFMKWIETGAIDPRLGSGKELKKSTALTLSDVEKHWAYRPLNGTKRFARESSSTTIDAFLDASIEEHGIRPAPEASKGALLRRLKMDLHGLPPTLEEIEAFESDPSPDAYERWVDRLLASPRYGERMARHWLDVARFAESYTLRGFVMPEAWRYRDYCIDAFSNDLPWNRFVAEQVAGDLMESADRQTRQRQQTAVTFLLMGNNNLEEQDKGQLDMDVIDEQLETLGRAFMGQTIGCARCHDHKFDPIPTRDYYALAGIFKSSVVLKHENVSKWVEVPLAMDEATDRRFQEIEKDVRRIQEEIKDLEKLGKPSKKNSGKALAPEALDGIVLDDTRAKKVGDWVSSGSIRSYVGDSYLHDGATGRGEKTVTFEPEALPPGTYEIRVSHSPGSNRTTKAMVRVFCADGDYEHRINQQQVAPIDGLWTSLGKYRFEKNGQAYVMVCNEDSDGHVIADAVQFLPLDLNLSLAASRKVDEVEKETREDSDQRIEREKRLKLLKESVKKLEEELDQRPMTMGLEPVEKPTDLPIHIRGSVHSLGEVVPRGFLQLTNASFQKRGNDKAGQRSGDRKGASEITRLELAEWLTDPRHPLTPRVAVNRIWYWMMGEGLVDTIDNFGTTGNSPSHPELLDYLSRRLIESGWSVKTIIREIVCSQAYRRSSDVRLAEGVDPENRWYGVAHRKRLDAEALRDSIYFASGQLSLDMGGRRIPKGVNNDYGYMHKDACRSIYIPALRNSMPDFLTTFDMADTSMGVGKRNRTTVAQQALVMLNHPILIEQSRAMASRWIKEWDDPRFLDRLAFTLWGRPLHEKERSSMLAFLSSPVVGIEKSPNDEKLGMPSKIDERRLASLIQSMFASLDFRYLE